MEVRILPGLFNMTVEKISIKSSLKKELDKYGSKKESYSTKLSRVLNIAKGNTTVCPFIEDDLLAQILASKNAKSRPFEDVAKELKI